MAVGLKDHEFRALFLWQQSIFAGYADRIGDAAAYKRVIGCRLVLSRRHFLPPGEKTPRDTAWYDESANAIHFLKSSLRSRGINVLCGIIRHEFGHVIDTDPHAPGAERRADALAHLATGQPIRYTRGGLQTIGKGADRRPDWLHQ